MSEVKKGGVLQLCREEQWMGKRVESEEKVRRKRENCIELGGFCLDKGREFCYNRRTIKIESGQ